MTNTDILYTRGCRVFKNAAGELQWRQCAGCQQMPSRNAFGCSHNAALPADIVEVRFKHTRKGFFKTDHLPLCTGDVVAVEAAGGHDIGMVSLTGDMAYRQMRRLGLNPAAYEYKKVYRKAKIYDIEKWCDAIAQEKDLMIRARRFASLLGLNMKIGDVEMLGNRTKAIFYYTAEERVDFRELLKVMTEEFKLRIEMKQIGIRQEAGRIGGIGICGREVCCSVFLNKFTTITADVVHDQSFSTNPQKTSGQCGRIKCCLTYEHSVYVDARGGFPSADEDILMLETEEGTAHHVKTDIFKRCIWYNYEDNRDLCIPVPVERVTEILEANRKGKKPPTLIEGSKRPTAQSHSHPKRLSAAADTPEHDSKGQKRCCMSLIYSNLCPAGAKKQGQKAPNKIFFIPL